MFSNGRTASDVMGAPASLAGRKPVGGRCGDQRTAATHQSRQHGRARRLAGWCVSVMVERMAKGRSPSPGIDPRAPWRGHFSTVPRESGARQPSASPTGSPCRMAANVSAGVARTNAGRPESISESRQPSAKHVRRASTASLAPVPATCSRLSRAQCRRGRIGDGRQTRSGLPAGSRGRARSPAAYTRPSEVENTLSGFRSR